MTCVLLLAAVAAPPNVLLITADDLGPQLNCYGDDTVPTPHMDALAARGTRFETCWVSQASCSPSRSTMFTGLFPHSSGQVGLANPGYPFRLREEHLDRLLPNLLKRAGYRTGIIGKLHVNPAKAFQWDVKIIKGFGTRKVRDQVASADRFISESGETPWLLMFNLFDPHVARKSLGKGKRGPQYFPDEVDGIPENPIGPADVSPWPWQKINAPQQMTKIAGYYNCVSRIDAAIGMLMERLEVAGHADDTLIIFLGDHGPPFTRGKTSCYDAGLRVPLLVVWPGMPAGRTSRKLASSADVYPTILDAAGVDLPETLQGRSLRPVLKTDEVPWRFHLTAEFHLHGPGFYFPRRAITDGHFNLIHNLEAGRLKTQPFVDGDQAYKQAMKLPQDSSVRAAFARLADPPEFELYYRRDDPGDLNNLIGLPRAAGIEMNLKTELHNWRVETNDPWLEESYRDRVRKKAEAGWPDNAAITRQ